MAGEDTVEPNIMLTSLKIIDDFYPLPEELKACALSLPDKDEVWDGHTYHGGRRYEHEGFKQIMASRLSTAVDAPVEFVIQSFVVATKGFETTQWIHADLGLGQYAAVLHLHNTGGGTAFWKHRQTGQEWISPEMLEQLGGPEKTAAQIQQEGQSEDAWEMVSLAGAKFNRIAIYPSALFHSRWPKDVAAETVEDGRITWIAFFNAGGFQ